MKGLGGVEVELLHLEDHQVDHLTLILTKREVIHQVETAVGSRRIKRNSPQEHQPLLLPTMIMTSHGIMI